MSANLLALVLVQRRSGVTQGEKPTSNRAERFTRCGVWWWNNALGCQSEAGCHPVELLLTVVQIRRLKGWSVSQTVYGALTVHRRDFPALYSPQPSECPAPSQPLTTRSEMQKNWI
jgi:hypothetical protein